MRAVLRYVSGAAEARVAGAGLWAMARRAPVVGGPPLLVEMVGAVGDPLGAPWVSIRGVPLGAGLAADIARLRAGGARVVVIAEAVELDNANARALLDVGCDRLWVRGVAEPRGAGDPRGVAEPRGAVHPRAVRFLTGMLAMRDALRASSPVVSLLDGDAALGRRLGAERVTDDALGPWLSCAVAGDAVYADRTLRTRVDGWNGAGMAAVRRAPGSNTSRT